MWPACGTQRPGGGRENNKVKVETVGGGGAGAQGRLHAGPGQAAAAAAAAAVAEDVASARAPSGGAHSAASVSR